MNPLKRCFRGWADLDCSEIRSSACTRATKNSADRFGDVIHAVILWDEFGQHRCRDGQKDYRQGGAKISQLHAQIKAAVHVLTQHNVKECGSELAVERLQPGRSGKHELRSRAVSTSL